MQEFIPLFVALLSFGTVAAIVFVAGQYLATQAQMQRRLPGSIRAASNSSIASPPSGLQAFIAKHFDEKRFVVDRTLRGKLRRELLRAGYFRSDAINYYLFFRIALAILLPSSAYLVSDILLANSPWYLKLLVVGSALLLGIIGPGVY